MGTTESKGQGIPPIEKNQEQREGMEMSVLSAWEEGLGE